MHAKVQDTFWESMMAMGCESGNPLSSQIMLISNRNGQFPGSEKTGERMYWKTSFDLNHQWGASLKDSSTVIP